MLKAMLIAGLGGFAGTALRYATGRLAHWMNPASLFPWGTFAVNIVGCFAIGVLFGLVEQRNALAPSMQTLLITGFCGGFTTFSTFADDIYLMLEQRHWVLVGGYVATSIALGLAMVWLGRCVVKTL